MSVSRKRERLSAVSRYSQDYWTTNLLDFFRSRVRERERARARVCVFVCVSEREIERESARVWCEREGALLNPS